MRTTVDIDPKLLAEAERIFGEHGVNKVVNAALLDVVRRQKLRDLRRLLESSDIDDTWETDEANELKEMELNRH